jgi:Family of unknown function (DUF6505)
MRLLRTIRLDPSDRFVFPAAAPPGEWAISAGFLFADVEPARLAGKELAAFRSGFLGFPSLGWSTLAQVVEVEEKDRQAAIDLLARCLLERLGAPDAAAALAAAIDEIDFAASLCDHPPETLIALSRHHEGGAIRETFRSLRPRGDRKPWRAFSFDAALEDEPDAGIDLAALAQRPRE